MKHTPTPWRIKDSRVSEAPEIISDTRRIAKVLYHGWSEDAEVIGNAKFIVEACNAHESLTKQHATLLAHRDALLKACRKVQFHLDQMPLSIHRGEAGLTISKAIAMCEKGE